MVVEQLFSRDAMARWLGAGDPPELLAAGS
jgi:hypothetical protein